LYFTLAGRAPFEGGDVVNKIYKHKMEDAPPLEKITTGVPAAFAAIVRKLMAKEPNDRYQSASDLKADLARWVDPKVIRAILGTEAEVARAFRPPPPELDDEDQRSLSNDADSLSALRELGDAESAPVPRRPQPPTAPRPAVLLPPKRTRASARWGDDYSWLFPFLIVVGVLGVLAVVLISALKH
jgi:serine/threonine-protein kinase